MMRIIPIGCFWPCFRITIAGSTYKITRRHLSFASREAVLLLRESGLHFRIRLASAPRRLLEEAIIQIEEHTP